MSTTETKTEQGQAKPSGTVKQGRRPMYLSFEDEAKQLRVVLRSRTRHSWTWSEAIARAEGKGAQS